MMSLYSRLPDATDDGQTPHAEDQRDSVAQFELQDPQPLLRVAITGYTIFTTAVVLVFGIWKAFASYRGEAILSTTLDWVIGVFFGVFLFWLGRFEMLQPPCLPWFFHRDYAPVFVSAWKYLWSIVCWIPFRIVGAQVSLLPLVQSREEVENLLHDFSIAGAADIVFGIRPPRPPGPPRGAALQSSTLKLRTRVSDLPNATDAAFTGGTASSTEQISIGSTVALTATGAPWPGHDSSTKASRRALSIAIRYTNLADPRLLLDGVHDDADRLVELLTDTFGYAREEIVVLRDCDGPKDYQPTRENIIKAMQDLVDDARPGDHLVCHFSGHSSKVQCLVSDREEDCYDEVFWPMNIENHEDPNDLKNFIRGDDMKRILIDNLPAGVNLVLIEDCGHFGTIADLHYGDSDHTLCTKGLLVQEERKESHGGKKKFKPLVVKSYGEPGTDSISANVVRWSTYKSAQVNYRPQRGAGFFLQSLIETIRGNVSQTHEQLLHNVSQKFKGLMNRYFNEAGIPGHAHDSIMPKPTFSSLFPQKMILELPILEIFGGMPTNSSTSPTANDT